MDKEISIGSAIQAERKKQFITQTQMANDLGKSQVWVSQLETGSRQITTDLLAEISAYFGMNPAELIGGARTRFFPSDRQYFAAAAMQGIISNADTMREITKAAGKDSDGAEFFRAVGNIAYKYADAMLEAQS